MKQKNFGIALIALGVCGLLCALGIKWYEGYAERQALLEIEKSVQNSVFIADHENSETSDGMDDGLTDIISSIDRDQEVEEVVTYKNVLDIPKIECQAYIGNDAGSYNLHRGVGRHPETVKVGAVGNCVIAGHASRTYKCIFNRLEEMQVLDQFYAYDADGNKHTYNITKRFVCPPDQLSILDNTDDGRSTMTIYTCTEGGTMRFVLVGVEFTEDELQEFKKGYYSDSINRMIALNDNVHVEEVCELIGMRSTRRTYSGKAQEQVELRPWLSGDAVYSDVGILDFGISQNKGVVTDDVASD